VPTIESDILAKARQICEKHGVLLRGVSELPNGFAVTIAVSATMGLESPEIAHVKSLLEAVPHVVGVWVELASVSDE
jgi:hypothetical protein